MDSERDFFNTVEQIMPEAERTKQERIEGMQEALRAIDAELSLETEVERRSFEAILREELQELNEMYGHVGENVLVSGMARVGYYNDETGRDEQRQRTLSNEPMVSQGFTINRGAASEGSPLQVGHLFMSLEGRSTGVNLSKLAEQRTRYFAFAPYGSVVIDTEATDAQRIKFLQSEAPELIDEVDETLLDAPSSLAAFLRLRQLSVDEAHAESRVAGELVTYVQRVIDFDTLPLLELKLQGLRRLDLSGITSLTIPYNHEDITGGGITVVGKIQGLHLAQYQSYVAGEFYTSSALHWGVSVAVEAAGVGNERFVGQEFEVCVADIREAKPAQPSPEL